jgi:hypothetical protein
MPNPLDYSPPKRCPTLRPRHLLLVILALTLLTYAHHRSTPPAPAPQLSSTPPARPPAATQPTPTQIYTEEILPLLAAFDARNQQAADRALANLHDRLNGRRCGIKPFVVDVSTWRTRFSVINRKRSDLWQRHVNHNTSADRVRELVEGKFRHFVYSDAALQHDLEETLKQFREDLDASRNQLYVELRLPLAKIKSPIVATDANFDAFKDDVRRRAEAIGRDYGTDSVVAGIGSFVAGWVAADVGQAIATRVVVAIATRAGTQVAAESLAAGGATAAGAAAGGGGGTLAGPAGTVIGFGVGIVAGAAVDWWLSDRFEAKMTAQLNQFFDALDHRLTQGAPGAPGLEQTLRAAVTLGNQTQHTAIEHAFLETTR